MSAKPKSSLLVVLIIASLTGSLLTPGASNASVSYVEGNDSAAAMFNPLKVTNFSMQMSDEDFDSLRFPNVRWNNEGPWRETRMSFTMEGKVYGPYTVGVHLKGAWGSWHDVDGRNNEGFYVGGKAAFKIKMDEFVKGQTLFGVSRITLNNMMQDRSSLRETISYRLYRNLGIPSPRTGYANVSLNGINYGLHLNIETLNKQMLKRWGHSSTHLYKGAVPWFPDLWRGSESMFAVESGDEDDRSDLTDFMAINELSGKAWFDAISSRMDIELLTVSWASEIYSGHWDGYVRNLNNYFVNFDDQGKVMLLPWGVDQTWGGSLGYTVSKAVMPNKCWEYAPCLEIYRQALAKVSRVARELDLPTTATTIATGIRPALESDPFVYDLGSVTASQNTLVSSLRNQQSVLSSLVRPFDTTLASFKVNDAFYNPAQTALLPAGTKTVAIQVTASQSSARVTIQPLGTLKPGFNKAFVVVTSSNGQHVNTSTLNLYVYTAVSLSRTASFHKNTSVPTFAGITSMGLMATDLLGANNLVLDIRMAKTKTTSTAKAKTLMGNRVKHLLKSLQSKGIRPQKVTQRIVTSGSVNSLQITAKYQK